MKGVLQPPHEELVVDVVGQEFVEGSHIQHDVEFAESYGSKLIVSATHTQCNNFSYPIHITKRL